MPGSEITIDLTQEYSTESNVSDTTRGETEFVASVEEIPYMPEQVTGNPAGMTAGQGRYYSEAIDDNSQVVKIDFGVLSSTAGQDVYTVRDLDFSEELQKVKVHVATGDDLRVCDKGLLEAVISSAHPDMTVEEAIDQSVTELEQHGSDLDLRREKNKQRRKLAKMKKKQKMTEQETTQKPASAEKLQAMANHFNAGTPRARSAALFLPSERTAAAAVSKFLEKNRVTDDDGIDHINIAAQAETELGRMLDPYTRMPFIAEGMGRFESIAGLGCWLLCGGKVDAFRTAYGDNVRKKIKAHRDDQVDGPQRAGLKLIQADAVYQMVMQYPNLARLLKESELPFKNYFLLRDAGIRQDALEARWLIPTVEAIRDALKDSTDENPVYPDFTFLQPRQRYQRNY